MSIHPGLLPAASPTEAAEYLLTGRSPGKPAQAAALVTLNPELLARAVKDPAFARLLRSAPGKICDGIGAALLLKAASPGYAVPRIPGIDLGEAVLALAAARGIPVFLLGGAPGVAKAAAKAMIGRYPDLQVAGTAHGYHSPADLPALRGMIARSGAEILFVCMGCPRQEAWIAQNRPYLPAVRLFLPLGGSLDVWAGRCRRAPRALQRAGGEWLWRIAIQPSRMGRLLQTFCRLAAEGANLLPKIVNIVAN